MQGEPVEPVDDVRRALAVGLHHDTEALPVRERRIREHRLDDVERKVEAIRLLGIHIQADAGRPGEQGERAQACDQCDHYPIPLPEFVTGVQG